MVSRWLIASLEGLFLILVIYKLLLRNKRPWKITIMSVLFLILNSTFFLWIYLGAE